MALTETYVDPSIAGNSGTGTVGDPYGDLQYALNTMTRDGTNGDRINIKAGTDEILTAALSLATYGTPTEAAQLLFQGYTSAADDGGIGGISGAASYTIISPSTLDFIGFVDLHLHNCGLGNDIIFLDNNITIINCELDLGNYAIDVDNSCVIIGNHIHNCDNIGIDVAGGSLVAFNYLENATNDFTTAINCQFQSFICFNILDIDGSTDGIAAGDGSHIMNNSVYSSSGTGSGIYISGTKQNVSVLNNIIEGFSGVGGQGVEALSGSIISTIGYNAFYNNTTNKTLSGIILSDLTAQDQALGSSPFTDAANDDFTVDTSVKALAYLTANFPNLSVRSYLDIGALQRPEAGLVVHPSLTGGMRS
jgi:hypothetical protein